MLEALLETERLGRARSHANEIWDCIGSTNTRAAELASEGAPEGVFVVARQQTAGRGRLGRTWVSPPDAGLYISVILRPTTPPYKLPVITLACGVAAAEAIASVSRVRVGLKWVNDLIVDGRKLGGILAEMPANTATSALPAAIVVGIGINVELDPDQIPPDLKDTITWLSRIDCQPPDRNLLAARLLTRVEKVYDQMLAGEISEILDRWRALSVTLGKNVRTESSGKTIEGTAIDIDDSGALIVETSTGIRQTLHAGEISIRTPEGRYC
ncbi:MAG TPA: biotin--[acetyl-CoA-carboxylase] ligase [Candidatus Obscuribacterales bacterium]